MKKKYLYIFFYLLFFLAFKQVNAQENVEDLRKVYKNLDENNQKALKYVRNYIERSLKEKNYTELKQAYEDYSYYSSNKHQKLKFADSALVAARNSGNNDLLSSAYLYKGSLYYFYFKNYQSALAEYLKAFQYSKTGTNDYLKYKIIYQMGLVKGYLGYHQEAMEHFEDCIAYFESKLKGKYHPNLIYNFKKGYFNSLHQIAVCYRHTKQYKKADSIISLGMNLSSKSPEFSLEQAYFLKSKGISEYFHKKYNSSVVFLKKASPVLREYDDFYWSSVSDFYVGKSFLDLGKEDLAIRQFQKVDSTFQKRQFIVPELLENYNLLIKHYHYKKDLPKELEYSKKLLKADSILNKDFKYLSAKIHKDYDRKILEESKKKLEKHNKIGVGTILILFLSLILLALLTWKYYNGGKRIKLKYQNLEKKLQLQIQTAEFSYDHISNYGKSVMSKEIFTDLQKGIQEFEDSKGFLEKGISLILLAEKLNTNTSYLSQYINDTKEMNFNKYISTLRINYITQLMYDNPKYLLLKIQGLANECGISSRQNFSDLFQEINGMRPTDFIKQRKAEIEKSGEI